jgi:hypothetical protein
MRRAARQPRLDLFDSPAASSDPTPASPEDLVASQPDPEEVQRQRQAYLESRYADQARRGASRRLSGPERKAS